MSINCGTEYETIRKAAIAIKRGYQGVINFENKNIPRMNIEDNCKGVICSIIPNNPSYFNGFNTFKINPKNTVSKIVTKMMCEVIKENEHIDGIEYLRSDTKKFFEQIKKNNGNPYRMRFGDKEVIFKNQKPFIVPYFKDCNDRTKGLVQMIPFDDIPGLEKIISDSVMNSQ